MSLISLLRRALLALGLSVALGAAACAETVTFDLPQARAFARAAALSGRPDLARQVALALLQQNPRDADALLALAAAEMQLANPKGARKAASLAFRAAPLRDQRYVAARLAAKSAFDQQRLTLAQYWLRRAGQLAPDAAAYLDTQTGFRQVQAQNRWRNTFALSFAPSSNINQGSNSDRLTIDGIPTIFTFSGDAMALSGTQLGVEAGTSYRIAATALSQTTAGLRLKANLVTLSDQARKQAAGAKGADYHFAALEAQITHDFILRPAAAPAAISVLAGRNWYGGAALSDYARVQLNTQFQLPGAQTVRLQGLAEYQWAAAGANSSVLALDARYDRPFAANRIGFRLGVVSQQSANSNAENRAVTAEITYALAKPIGPAQATIGMQATSRDYPAYFNNLFNDNGRQDVALGLTLDLLFPKAQVFGFAPQLTLSASRTRSNISRFEQTNIGVTIGLKSVF